MSRPLEAGTRNLAHSRDDDSRTTVARTPLAPERECWRLLQSGSGTPAYNLALDEALLEGAVALGQPVLRLYAWTEPAATFGYSQSYSAVANMTSLRPLVRRPTGGGLVPHDRDWTYSLTVPPTHPWYGLAARRSYHRIHLWVSASLTALGLAVELAPSRRREVPGQCFAGAEQWDVLWHGRKIAGAAQRRNRLGLLIEGSVQPPPELRRSDWEAAAIAQGAQLWACEWRRLEPDAALQQRVEELVQTKYGLPTYNQSRR